MQVRLHLTTHMDVVAYGYMNSAFDLLGLQDVIWLTSVWVCSGT